MKLDLLEKYLDREAAKERIEQYRKGNASIRVTDREGIPVKGLVKIRQQEHEFLFGSNAFGWGKMEPNRFRRFDWMKQEASHQFDPNERIVGHGTQYADGKHEDDVLYTARFRALFNAAVIPFYERAIEPEEGVVNLHRAGRMADWARKNGLTPKGHPLVFHNKRLLTKWQYAKDAATYWPFITRRVKQILETFSSKIGLWDYANELISNPLPGNDLLEAAVRTYHLAREHAPSATLTLNDYACFGEHADTYVELLSKLRQEGAMPDVFGIQSHFWQMDDQKRIELQEALDKYEKTGIPIHFTETTFAAMPGDGLLRWEAEARHAVDVAEFYTYLFSRPQVEGIFWWDFCDRHSFSNNGGLLRDDLSMKPAYEALQQLIRKAWQTELELPLTAGETGNFRGFYGTYEAEIELENGTRYFDTFRISKGDSEGNVTLVV